MAKQYLKPCAEVTNSRIRAYILAGSDKSQDVVDSGTTTGKDFEFSARQRTENNSLD